MVFRIFKILLFGSLLIIASCSSDDGCTNEAMNVMDLMDFGCQNPVANVTVNSLNEFELIRSQEDYVAIVTDRCSPSVDWQQYDLVAGTVVLLRGLESIEKALRMNCELNRLELTFTIRLSITQEAPQITLNAVIPKLQDNVDIYVDRVVIE